MTGPDAGAAYPARQRFARGSVVHAVTAMKIPAGSGWGPGEPLCGTFADLEPCPPGLFAEPVTCTRCVAVAEREHVTIADPPDGCKGPGQRSPGRQVMTAVQLELFPAADPIGPRGFPLCRFCGRESIGPRSTLCFRCWTPARDPEGWRSWQEISARHGVPQ